MTRRMHCVLALGVCAWSFGACATTPREPVGAAESAVTAGDLSGALVLLDSVRPDHPRYAEARGLAHAVERRMRRGHEALIEALLLRAEWRDSEALARLSDARELWPNFTVIHDLEAATRHRLAVGAPTTVRADGEGSVAMTRPPSAAIALGSNSGSGSGPMDDGEILETQSVVDNFASQSLDGMMMAPAPLGEMAPPGEAAPTPSDPAEVPAPEGTSGVATATPSASKAAGSRTNHLRVDLEPAFRRVDLHLRDGALDAAIDVLEGLHAENLPVLAARSVAARLVRVRNQRGLVRYGQGYLEAAISDWSRVETIHAKAPVRGAERVVGFLRAARAELAMQRAKQPVE